MVESRIREHEMTWQGHHGQDGQNPTRMRTTNDGRQPGDHHLQHQMLHVNLQTLIFELSHRRQSSVS